MRVTFTCSHDKENLSNSKVFPVPQIDSKSRGKPTWVKSWDHPRYTKNKQQGANQVVETSCLQFYSIPELVMGIRDGLSAGPHTLGSIRITWGVVGLGSSRSRGPLPLFLIRCRVRDGAREYAFVTNFQVMSVLLAHRPCFENHWSGWFKLPAKKRRMITVGESSTESFAGPETTFWEPLAWMVQVTSTNGGWFQ